MKKTKRILSLIFAVIMVLSAMSTVFAANVTFTDVSSHWAWTRGYIPYLVEKGVINGYTESNGTSTFRPEVPVTRAEFIKMLDETFGLTKEAAVSFNDVKESDWFYKYFLRAKAQGYLLNYGNNANPNGYISREEATALLVRYLDLPSNEKLPDSTFTDISSVSSYYKNNVLMAAYAGIINGNKEADGTYTFRPKATLTRAEALTILYRAAGCIFNETSYSRNSGAHTQNNVITTGDIVVKNITLSGRNIITEGATSGKITFSNCKFEDTLYIRGTAEVTFDNCTVKEVIAIGGGKIILSNKTTVSKLSAYTKTAVTAFAGTKIAELNIGEDAAYSSHSGSGTIDHAVINAAGFKSTTLPASFDIAGGISASFASATYSGISTAGDTYTLSPFVSLNNSNYFINLVSSESGDIYYYFTNTSTLPSANDFDTYHARSDYAGSFSVTEDKYVSAKTFSEASVKNYSYIVLQLQSGDEKFAPVVIPNTASSDSGFKVAPHIDPDDNMKILLQTKVSGTLYLFYTNEGNQLTQIEFLEAFEDTESALRKEQTLTASKTASFTLQEKFLNNYDYVSFMYQSATGVYYLPVTVTVGDNGFSSAPEITSLGIIEFTPSVSGDLYYYYSDTNILPTASNFLEEYSDAAVRKKITVKKKVHGEIEYDLSRIDDYQYLVIAICNESGDFLAPVAVAIDLTTGFKREPEVVNDEYLEFKTEKSGNVKWYYTNSDIVPTVKEFNELFEEAAPRITCGTISTYANSTTELNLTTAAGNYKYIVLMLVDSTDTEHFPIVVELDVASTKGFTTKPFVSEGKIWYEVDTKGEVWYYYTSSSSTVTSTNFENNYGSLSGQYKGRMDVEAETLYSFDIISDIMIEQYNLKYAVVAYFDPESGKFSVPVVISVNEIATSKNSGIVVSEITDDKVTVTVNHDGTLLYYMTNSSSTVSANTFHTNYYEARAIDISITGEINASKDNAYNVTLNSNYDYIVFVLDRGTGDLMVPLTADVSTPSSSGATSTSYGFAFDTQDKYDAITSYTLDIIPHLTGTITITFKCDGVTMGGDSVPVTQNTKVKLDWSEQVKFYSRLYDDITVNIQFKSESKEYTALSIMVY